ncbi:AraC family transcriptional regulator [Ruminococcaceae bacterium OttesenSCG-928-L11]|nr:AraC family transcriptional regulator [Ruminococcaceae bacterium OttesenSCG-928-L11]MDL2233485.1 AraC family transcriptional regulator [Ruminococcaceae bacterium OttesenSCG-928-L11]
MQAYFEQPRAGVNMVYTFEVRKQHLVGPGVMTQAHFHNYVEILYGLQGRFEAGLGNATFAFGVGDLVVIRSQEVHRMLATDDGRNEYAVIKFDPSLLFTPEQSASELKYLLDLMMDASMRRLFLQDELGNTGIPALIEELMEETVRQEYGYELAIRAGFCKLFVLILRQIRAADPRAGDGLAFGELEKLQAVFNYVEGNYGGVVTMEEAARLLDLSYSSFSRFFSRHAHKSFSDYVCDVRISKAKILLATTDGSITDIAMETGFSTTSYFIYCFRRRSGVSPLQYRKQFAVG